MIRCWEYHYFFIILREFFENNVFQVYKIELVLNSPKYQSNLEDEDFVDELRLSKS